MDTTSNDQVYTDICTPVLRAAFLYATETGVTQGDDLIPYEVLFTSYKVVVLTYETPGRA